MTEPNQPVPWPALIFWTGWFCLMIGNLRPRDHDLVTLGIGLMVYGIWRRID